jgi:DNA invertase Pin-like site-specific DNA recombinase
LVTQLTGHDFLKSLGVTLIPTTAPDFFTEETPTAVLVRQVLGAIAQFEKASLVNKLKAARDRRIAQGIKCGGRKSFKESHPEMVALAKELARPPEGFAPNRGLSLRKVSAALAERGYLAPTGKPYSAMAVRSMLS